MTTSRRPATAADLSVGSIVYKGAGRVAYRITGVETSVRGELVAWVTKAASKSGTAWEHLATLTVDA